GGTAQAQPPLPGWPLRPDELDGPAHQDRTTSVERPGTGWTTPAERPATDRTTPAERPGADRTASVERPGTGRGPYTRRPRHAAPSGVAQPDAPAPEAITPDTAGITGAAEVEAGTARVSRPARAGRRARRRHRAAGGGHRHRHYDWIWELVGFLICVAIAMIVFFAVPTIVTP
ncbi:hypothetical protein AB0J28_39085, partial [Streptosporangium canum]|uniref:hypothetical protein n=1 Tax=Streptosporangium canum TaxID=324952 RepID=UPI003479267E